MQIGYVSKHLLATGRPNSAIQHFLRLIERSLSIQLIISWVVRACLEVAVQELESGVVVWGIV